VARFRLKEEEKVGILLQFAVIGIVTFGRIYFFKCSFNFSLLYPESDGKVQRETASVLHREPSCFESTAQFESPDTGHLAPTQNSFWTVLKFWL